jgi:O-glycosyl hydrolase
MSVMATTWVAPSAMKTQAWMAMAFTANKMEATSHTMYAGRLTPAEQRHLVRCTICGA